LEENINFFKKENRQIKPRRKKELLTILLHLFALQSVLVPLFYTDQTPFLGRKKIKLSISKYVVKLL
jgi:hypothetical protein